MNTERRAALNQRRFEAAGERLLRKKNIISRIAGKAILLSPALHQDESGHYIIGWPFDTLSAVDERKEATITRDVTFDARGKLESMAINFSTHEYLAYPPVNAEQDDSNGLISAIRHVEKTHARAGLQHDFRTKCDFYSSSFNLSRLEFADAELLLHEISESHIPAIDLNDGRYDYALVHGLDLLPKVIE